MSSRPRRLPALGGLILWILFLTATIEWTLNLDLGGSRPPLRPGDWYGWAELAPPESISMELLRLVVLATCLVLLTSSLVGLLTSVLRPGRFSRSVLRLVPAIVRAAIETAAGVGLTGVLLTGPVHMVGADPRPPVTAVMQRNDPPPRDTPAQEPEPPVTALMRRNDPPPRDTPAQEPEPPPTTEPSASPAVTAGSAIMRVQDEIPPPAPDRDQVRELRTAAASSASDHGGPSSGWTVRPGDNLWDIAEATVREHSRHDDPVEVLDYWQRLIEANRSRLVHPDDPGLILPGQVFILPPL